MSLKLELRNLKFQQNAGIRDFLQEKPNIRYSINKKKDGNNIDISLKNL